VGQIIANDTLGTPAAPLASGTTVASVKRHLKWSCRNATNTDVTPITTGTILVMHGNVTIAANTQRDLTRLPIPSVSPIHNRVNVKPSNCTTATLTVNVVGQIIAGNDTLGTPAAFLQVLHQ
jgi:hypothetical protein